VTRGVANTRNMTQDAPYPDELAELVSQLEYRKDRDWKVWLEIMERDAPVKGRAGSSGLTLVIQRCGPDSYHPEQVIRVNHYFPVPPAIYDSRSWQRWLFNRLGDVDDHERMEDFVLVKRGKGDGGEDLRWRPYKPSHGPGNDPYLVRELATEEDQRTSFRGELNPS
jgi:hypothetical protein